MPKSYIRSLFTFLFLAVAALTLQGQDINISEGGTRNTCNGTLYDAGGPTGNHSAAGQFQEITLCSDNSTGNGTHIQLTFTQFDVEGTLVVFNGTSTAADTLWSNVNGNPFSQTFRIPAATDGNASGCVTVRFESTGSAPGWAANVRCVVACKPIIAILTGTTPAADPPTPEGYIDVCPGDPITFSATGEYPESGGAYVQSDAASLFIWNFQDGNIDTGTTVTHVYDDPGGYIVQLTIEDQMGCTNTNNISQRVRVSPPPNFQGANDIIQDVCAGEDVSLTVGQGTGNGTIDFDPMPREFSFVTSQTFSELTFLPDGDGDQYESPLVFTNFDPGQILTSSSDIVRICASMEHSYLGDLDIRLQCPDGNQVELHRYDPSDAVAGQILGQGVENTVTPDPPSTYCWTASAPETMAQAVVSQGIMNDQSLPAGDYAAESGFNNLVGCELNGEWSMVIIDNISRDQGYIYEWTIEFASDVYPNQETFVVPLVSTIIQDNGLYPNYTPGNVTWNPEHPGPNTVRIVSTDDYGCQYDTAVVLNVLPPYAPNCVTCGPILPVTTFDTSICSGESFQPNIIPANLGDTIVRWQSVMDEPFGRTPYSSITRAFENEIVVTNHFPTTITDVTQDIQSVCVDLINNGDLGEVTLQLISPNGRAINLIQNDGGNGENLQQTCFTPLATDPIASGTAPYTGDFTISSGFWTDFQGSSTNGAWRLRAWDDFGNDIGNLLRWSIDLRYNPDLFYTWSPNDGSLSCTNCPNPVITPSSATTYTLEVSTASGCTDQATVTVDFNTLDLDVANAVTNPNCPGDANGRIDLVFPAGTPALNFLWENGSTGDTLVGLAAGTYLVTITDPNACTQVESFDVVDPPALSVVLDSVTNVFCNGGSTGEIFVTTTGGSGSYTFSWDDPNAQNDEDAGALTQGTYNLLVTDSLGCTATLSATVNEPAPLALNFTAYAVSCRNGDNGRAVVDVTGGNGGYAYAWDTGASTDSIFNLTTGTFNVTVTDVLGCQTTGSVLVAEPSSPLVAQTMKIEQGCFGTSTNQATVTASGGFGSYTDEWANGETAATAIALPAGINFVTITDGGGCEQVASVATDDLPELTVGILATAPSCSNTSDGRLGAVPAGGVGTNENDYTFNWSNNEVGIVIINLPGDVLYRVTATDTRGCTGIGERFLPQPDPITFTTDETQVDCFGNSTGGLTISNISGPNPGAYDLQWGANAGFSTSNTISGLPAGSYALEIQDAINCTLDTVLRITEPPVLAPDIDKVDVSCFGEADGMINVLGTGGVGGYQYSWDNGSSQNLLASLPAGTYTLTLTDANSCTSITPVDILEPAAIGIQVTDNTSVICEGEATGSLTVMGTGGRPPFVYGLENQGFSRNNVFIGLQAGEYVAFVRDSAGCQTTVNATIMDGPAFSVDLGADSTIIFGDSITLTADIVGGVDSLFYSWSGSYPGTLSCLDCPDPFARPEYEIDYTLVLRDINGCLAEDRFRVSVRKIREVAVPTGFSPNGDGRNDILIVHGRPGTRVSSFAVYDQWSNILFEDGDYPVNDTSRGWDGNHKGEPVNAGVYLYKMVIEYEDGSTETLAGETTLIR